MTHATRDFLGHGAHPPDPRWPNGARVAVSFVVNVEEGAELSIVDGDERNEAVYEVTDAVRDAPDPCRDTHCEYGTRVGCWGIMQVLDSHAAPSTLNACGRAIERSPGLARDAVARGHEVNPNTSPSIAATLCAAMEHHAAPGTVVIGETAAFGCRVIATRASFAIASHAALDADARHAGTVDAATGRVTPWRALPGDLAAGRDRGRCRAGPAEFCRHAG